jgi:hypothetical protein
LTYNAEVDTDTLAELARASTREQFIAKLPHRFLIIEGALFEQEAVGFSTRVVDPASAKRIAKQATKPELEVLEIVKAPGNPYPDRVSVGRARNCDVVMRDPSVSKLHAHFKVAPGVLELVDIDSQNGTRVNGRSLAPHQAQPVEPGDTIIFGNVNTRLIDAQHLYDLLK